MPDDDRDDDDDRPSRRREDDDDRDDDRPRRRRRHDPGGDIGATDLIVPGGSGYAIFALYGGLIGFCLPLVGLLFAIPALVCGIIALRRWRKSDTYGNTTSNIRAVIGVILSGLGVLLWGGILVVALVTAAMEPR